MKFENRPRGWTLICSLAAICGVFLFVALFTGSFWGIHVVAMFVTLCAVITYVQADNETPVGDYVLSAGFLAIAAVWWTIEVKWPLYIAMIVIGMGLSEALSDDDDESSSET